MNADTYKNITMVQKGDTIINARTGQRMTFLKTRAETNGSHLQIECFSPQTSAREREHIHPYQENRFTILKGVLKFNIDGEEQLAFAGDVVTISKNVPHHFWNPGTTEAHYIQEFFPALKTDILFKTFFALARDGKLNKRGSPNIFRTSLIMLAHENEIRVSKPNWTIQKIVFKVIAPVGKMLGYRAEYL